jgi:hypothetical protein
MAGIALRRKDIDMGCDAIDRIVSAIKTLHDAGDEALAKNYEHNLLKIAAIAQQMPSDKAQKPG